MRARRGAGVLFLLAVAGSAGCLMVNRHPNLGVPDRGARTELSSGTIVFVDPKGVHVCRGDGTGARLLVSTGDLGRGGAAFMPALDAKQRHLLFLSVEDLDVRESTGRNLSLNVLTLESPAAPGARIASWQKARLEKIAPPGPNGRQEIFAVAGAAWSRDGRRIALGLNRPAAEGGDAVMLFDDSAHPLLRAGLGGRDLARVSALSWSKDDASIVLGLEGEEDTPGVVARLDLPAAPGAKPRVVDLAPGRYPMLSPDGTRVAAVDEKGGQTSLVLLDTEGREMSRFERPAGRALSRPFWAPDGRYLYYYSLASTGPLGLVEITILRCLDTRTKQVYDLVRLG